MKKILLSLFILFALPLHAQVFDQNQLIIKPYQGVIYATSTSGITKLSATTSPTVGTLTATTSLNVTGTATSTFAGGVSTVGLSSTNGLTITGGALRTGSSIITPFTAGSILFANTGGLVAQNNDNFFWDNTNARLGLRTPTPSTALHIGHSFETDSELITLQSGGTPTIVFDGADGEGAKLSFKELGGEEGYLYYNRASVGDEHLELSISGAAGSSGDIIFKTAGTQQWRIDSTGNFLPVTTNTEDIGSATKRVKDVYIAGTLNLSTPLIGASGGTGLSSYLDGDLLYGVAPSSLTQLGIGASSTILTSNGTIPSYTARPQFDYLRTNSTTATTSITGGLSARDLSLTNPLPVSSGGTGTSTQGLSGQTLVASTTIGKPIWQNPVMSLTDFKSGTTTNTAISTSTLYHPAGVTGGFMIVSNQSAIINTIVAFPWVCHENCKVNSLIGWVGTAGGAGSRTRFAVYENSSSTALFPTTLVTSTGELISDATGRITGAVNWTPEVGKLYWIAYWTGVATPTLRGSSTNSAIACPMGIDQDFGVVQCAWQVTRTYDAVNFPATFPTPSTGASMRGSSAVVFIVPALSNN